MKCSTCAAKCCAIYILDDNDWIEIANNMEISSQELTNKYPERTQMIGPVRFCIFTDPMTFRCTIYQYRPDICSKYFCNEWEGF